MNSIKLLDRDFHYGIGFLTELLDNTGLSLYDIDDELKNNPVSIIPKMVYYSLLYSYKRSKKDVDFDMFDINDLIDDNGGLNGDFVISFLNGFTQSLIKDVPVEDSKKKAIKKR